MDLLCTSAIFNSFKRKYGRASLIKATMMTWPMFMVKRRKVMTLNFMELRRVIHLKMRSIVLSFFLANRI